MSHARAKPGLVVLESLVAFCFCGTQGNKELNSIERVQLGFGSEWRTLGLNSRIAKTFNLGAASMRNRIVVFGGEDYVSYIMFAFTEEGEFQEDLSSEPPLPGALY